MLDKIKMIDSDTVHPRLKDLLNILMTTDAISLAIPFIHHLLPHITINRSTLIAIAKIGLLIINNIVHDVLHENSKH